MSGAVPGAAELTAIRERAERWGEASLNGITVDALYCMAESARDDLPALLALADALTGALARAVGGERWAEPVYAPGALVQVASWRCRFCGGRASPQEHIAHTADCPVRVLARARGGTGEEGR
jgi:hypothetical protein